MTDKKEININILSRIEMLSSFANAILIIFIFSIGTLSIFSIFFRNMILTIIFFIITGVLIIIYIVFNIDIILEKKIRTKKREEAIKKFFERI